MKMVADICILLNTVTDQSENMLLLTLLQFQRKVQLVKPVPEEGAMFGIKWEVTTQSVLDPQDQGETDLYDAVIVCNG